MIKMWDMSSIQCVNTTREVFVETEVNVTRSTITKYVKKESAEIQCVEKDTQNHASFT